MNKKSTLKSNLIGAYGSWAADSAARRTRSLSFLDSRWEKADSWRIAAREKVNELLAGPEMDAPALEAVLASVRVNRRHTFDGLDIEELTWQLPYGPETRAVFLKPEGAGADDRFPGVLALHDHGAVKYFGKRKILRLSAEIHPYVAQHQQLYYGGVGWANELARRGYAVLVHDTFPFASRRINAADLPGHVVDRMLAPPREIRELTPEDIQSDRVVTDFEVDPDEPIAQIEAYHAFAARHEDILAKSLISAGMTWPGVFISEDRIALEVLCRRPDVNPERVGCCGLSLGGLRTDYLAGLEDRIRCAVSVGFMSTWRDFILHSCYTHTWMLYIPLLSRFMDFPEVLGMRAPLPTMVLACDKDPLYTLEEVKKAVSLLERIFDKAGSPQNFAWTIYPGPHQFDLKMQAQAFDWLDRHLA